MARKKLALDDDQVVAIVEAINAAQGLGYYTLGKGALAKEALAPLAERYDAIQADHRDQMRAEYRREAANHSTTYRDGSGPRDRMRDMRIPACGIALKLGHNYPLVQGESAECSRCGMTGRMGESLMGELFRERCK